MRIINILFCIFLLTLTSCNGAHKTNTKQPKSRQKRDIYQEEVQQEKPKSPEELLKAKLDDEQKKQLDWLKDALGNDGEFNKFLRYDEDKIQEALEHIKTELASCTGNQADQQKNTFKELVKGFFKNGDINNFNKDNVTSNCNN
ncbi:Mlp family lipoprotein [Borreliella afzelii]|uniref:Mlp family lipoprotein n=1 Tax=Borreliella afzelii TaxID=29518 RepID=UPI003AF4F94A